MRAFLGIFLLLIAVSSARELHAAAPGPDASLDIHAPDATAGFWGRYFIIQKAGRTAGWITSEDGAALYRITSIHPSEETHFKAIIYVPGCALQTVDMVIAEPKNYQYSFVCAALPQVRIQGLVALTGSSRTDMTVEAKYVASWAPAFFEYDDGTTTEIPMGSKTTLDNQNGFTLQIPDFAKDKLAASPDHPGEIRIWARDQTSGHIVDQLRWASDNTATPPTRLGGIPIAALEANKAELKFCEADNGLSHDSYGFAVRNEENCIP